MITAEDVDLSNCDREQIQFSGAVQPHGCLLVVEEPSLRIVQASVNTDVYFGIPHGSLIGRDLTAALGAHARQIAERLAREALDHGPVHIACFSAEAAARPANLFAHRCEGGTILEFEAIPDAGEHSLIELCSELRAVIAKLDRTGSLQAFLDLAVAQIKLFTGFERVMAYKFLEDGSGRVVAEAVSDGLEPYLELHYPASDIPAPARRLFAMAWLRHLPDVDYKPIPILPASNPLTQAPLDQSYGLLRSVSVMYSAYLKNMGVKATMVMPLMKDGKLWGLISAMHHSAPRHVPYEKRLASEFLAQMLSQMTASKEDAENFAYRLRIKATLERIMQSLSERSDLHASLRNGDGRASLAGYVDCGGAAVVTRDAVTLQGATPSESEVRQLAQAIAQTEEVILASDRLGEVHPPARAYAETAAGLLAVRLSKTSPEYAMWFRPEQARTVHWAGDPTKPVEVELAEGALRPRTSFALWKEEVKGHSYPWADFEIEAAADLRLALGAHLKETHEALLQRSEDRFHRIVETALEGVWMLDSEARTSFVNARMAELLGYTPEEMLGRNFTDFMEEEWKRLAQNRLAARKAGLVETQDFKFQRKTGLEMWAQVSTLPIFEKGEFAGTLGMVIDITTRKQAEEALRRSEELNRRTLQALPAEIAVLDRNGQIIATNQAWRDFATGNTAANGSSIAVGANYLEVCRRAASQDELVTPVFDGLKDVVEGRRLGFSLEYPCHSPEEERWFLMTAAPLEAHGGAVVTHLNITERKQAEAALRDADRAKDDFLATLAHELRNPLAPVRNGLDVLRTGGAQAPSVERLLATMDGQVDHLIRLVDDLMDISRISRGKFELQKQQMDLAAALSQAVNMSRHLFEAEDLDIRLNLSGRAMPVDGDAVRLTQVFVNLLNNAAKHTSRGGSIQITLDRVGDEAVVRISDTGVGISKELLPHIFDPFVQGEGKEGRLKQGLGIGLALVRRITEMHGGVVEAQSQGEGLGSAFIVRLPLLEAATAQPPAPQSSSPRREAARRVLVIDDVPDLAEALVLLLSVLGANVRVAHGGAEGLEICAEFEPELVLLDLSMPKMDGFETARRMRECSAGRRAKLVAVTGYGEERTRVRAQEAGFDAHLVKPARLNQLKELLDSLGAGAAQETYK